MSYQVTQPRNMADKKVNPYFDPDEVRLTKEQLRQIIDSILEQWKKNTSRKLDSNQGTSNI